MVLFCLFDYLGDIMNNLKLDQIRYGQRKMPLFQKYYRKYQHGGLLKYLYRLLFVLYRNSKCIDMSIDSEIGPGLYVGHPSGITINPKAVIGRNCNIHKGITIGQENRGIRKGVPTIGNNVWIGINATIVGKIHVGNDVLIAANSFVNVDVPDHSIVFGNPCIIKRCEYATEAYINNAIPDS